MMLGELIELLEEADPGAVLEIGLGDPHAHPIDAEGVAFEPIEKACVSEMLANARSVLNQTLIDARGHEHRIDGWAQVYLARHGCCGEALGRVALNAMLGRTLWDGLR